MLALFTSLSLVAPSMGSGASGHRIELAPGRLDGHVVLGQTVASVTAVLGRPDYRSGSRPRFVLGWGSRPDFSVEVIFRPRGAGERAWSIAFEQRVRDVKLGDLLGRSSAALQRAVTRSYADVFTLVRPYACSHGSCAGEFADRTGSLHLTFGTHPSLGTWLTMWR